MYKDIDSKLDEILARLSNAGIYAGLKDNLDATKKLDKATEEAEAAIKALLTEAEYRGIERVLLKLTQASPVDWLDAQTWIDSEYARLQELKATLDTKETHHGDSE